jgi:hypothetical protein
MSWKGRKMQQHREPRRSLDQRSNGGTGQPKDEVAFPVTRYGAIVHRGWAFADENLRRDKGLATTACSLPGHAQRSSCPQAGGELASKGAAPLDVQGLVDRFVADAHRSIFGEVDRQSVSDLFWAPRARPSSVLPWSVASSLPSYRGASDHLPARSGDLACQPVLDIVPQHSIDRQLSTLRTSCRTIGMPLRRDRPILEASASGGGVASQLTRDRGRGTRKLPRDLANPVTLSPQESDLLALSQ